MRLKFFYAMLRTLTKDISLHKGPNTMSWSKCARCLPHLANTRRFKYHNYVLKKAVKNI